MDQKKGKKKYIDNIANPERQNDKNYCCRLLTNTILGDIINIVNYLSHAVQ